VKFTETPLAGAYVIDIEPRADERGFFARTWCREEVEALGLNAEIAQCSTSYNKERGTLRGMHYQARPYAECKFVRCIRGAIYDVILDLRPSSPTYKEWFGVELTADNRRGLFIPEDLAHGFQTLADDTEVYYQISEFYQPDYSRGVRWNDPAFNIRWPLEERIMSERDLSFPDFRA
jgi:dTDP-4-dehydrorhamnose 3,5-epimerase